MSLVLRTKPDFVAGRICIVENVLLGLCNKLREKKLTPSIPTVGESGGSVAVKGHLVGMIW